MTAKTICLTLTLLFIALIGHTQLPSANFTASGASGCSPLVTTFQDLSGGNPTSWFWDFGNGATSTLQHPSTTYFTPGTYTVKLTVTNAAGTNTITRTNYITVYTKPTANFSVNDSVGCYPLHAQFSDGSVAAPGTQNVAWLWDFGDGTQSTAQNPAHTYTAAGNYTVTMKVTNDKGCFAFFAKPQYIQIADGANADFTVSTTGVCRPPFPVTFTSSSTSSGALTYLWDFGDGTGTSTLQNPSYTYTTNGVYSVKLTVTTASGCVDTITKVNLLNFSPVTTSFTAPDSICVNSTANFLNSSTPPPQNGVWDFGDGQSTTGINTSHLYTTVGTYTILLTNTYSTCTDTVSKKVRVMPRPVVSFSVPDSFSCKPPYTVNFNDATPTGVSWFWDFGDGTTSTQHNPTHTYTSYGNFDVKLVVTNGSGCSDSLTKPALIKIIKPVISFPTLPQKGCVPYTANFNANINTLDQVTSWFWEFGDGATSNQQSPSHVYPNQGTYTIKLTITTSTGCTIIDSMPGGVKVGRKPIVDFSATPNPVCAFSPVAFTNLTNESDEWFWIFGDGITSTQQNPSHAYTDTGLFTIRFIVSNNGCTDSAKKVDYIRVKPPIARFYFLADCSNRLRFTFKDSSIGATTWFWEFGDGNTSTQQNPVHIYAAYGTYTVKLTVTNGSCTHAVTQNVIVFNEQPGFALTPGVSCKPALVTFTATNLNTANIVSYNWTFGDGNLQTTNTPSATNTYVNSGDYVASVRIIDLYGCAYNPASKPVRVNGPVSAFTGVNLNGCKGLTSTFTTTSQGDGQHPIILWKWNFGDGNFQTLGTGAQVQHTYPNPGTYTVTLTVTDAVGCQDSLVRISYVNTSDPKASFTVDSLACPGSPLTFNNTSTGLNYSSTWTFGDGSAPSTQQSPGYSYADTGHYTIRLIIVDQYGCRDTATKPGYIHVGRPIASFAVSDSFSSCAPFEVHYTNTSQFWSSASWNLNGGASTAASPVQYIVIPGTYVTQLFVTSPGGCTDTATRTVKLYDTIGTKIRYTPLNGCKPLDVQLIATSNGHLRYTWDFGDGVIFTNFSDTLNHIYNFFGDFVPKLIMTDSSGCNIAITGIDTIRIIGATAKFGLDKKFFCDSGYVNFMDSTTFNDPIITYHWDFGDGIQSNQQVPSHQYSAPGFYTVTLDVRTANNCVDTFRLNNVIKIVESPLAAIGGDSVICLNEFMQHFGVLLRPDTSLVSWKWQFPNGHTASVQGPALQQYIQAGVFPVNLIATNTSGCADTTIKNIRVNPLPVINMPPSYTKQTGFPITLAATYSPNAMTWTWSPGQTLNCTNCPQPVTTTKFNTKYLVSVVDSNGCRNSKEVQVIVLCPGANVFLPNTFSPNGDGSNDIFYVRGRGLERVKALRIFNRWGEIVYEANNFPANDPQYGWNGKYKGHAPAPDVYVYQVEVFCENGEVVRFDGNVALLQ